MKQKIMNLHLFDGDQGGDGGQGGTGGGDGTKGNTGGTFTYEQLDEIATSRAERAGRAALKNYFQQKGMSEEEADTAFAQYKEQKQKNQPNISAVERERDEARKELEQLKNQAVLRGKGVSEDNLEFVMFKVSKMVDDKTDFAKAADKYLKENPKYAGTASSYRVSASTATGEKGDGGNLNSSINNAIRNAIRR